jgi:hypothetical protein
VMIAESMSTSTSRAAKLNRPGRAGCAGDVAAAMPGPQAETTVSRMRRAGPKRVGTC